MPPDHRLKIRLMLPLCDVSEHDQEVGRVQVPLRPEPGGGARGDIQSPGDGSVFAECRHCPGSTKLDVAVLQLAQPPQLVLSSAAARVLHSSAAPRVSCAVSAVPPPAAATWTVCWGGDTGHCTSEEVQVDICTYLSIYGQKVFLDKVVILNLSTHLFICLLTKVSRNTSGHPLTLVSTSLQLASYSSSEVRVRCSATNFLGTNTSDTLTFTVVGSSRCVLWSHLTSGQ